MKVADLVQALKAYPDDLEVVTIEQGRPHWHLPVKLVRDADLHRGHYCFSPARLPSMNEHCVVLEVGKIGRAGSLAPA